MKSALLYQKSLMSDELKPLILLKEETSLGKSPNADVIINDWRCNGIHALIKNHGNSKFTIIDLNSTFGTFQGKKQIKMIQLTPGQSFKIGDSEFIIEEKSNIEAIPLAFKGEKDAIAPKEIVLSGQKTILEVGLYWGDKLLEVQQFKPGSIITIGAPRLATFTVPEGAIEHLAEKKFNLAEYQKGTLVLHIPKNANGILWTDNQVYNIDTLRLHNNKNPHAEIFDFNCRMGDKAHIEIGDLTLRFEFIVPAEKIPFTLKSDIDPVARKILLSLLLLFMILMSVIMLADPKLEEKSLDDIPMEYKKVVYQIGIENANKVTQAAIGDIAQTLEGGRARSEEGESSAKKSPEKQTEVTPKDKNDPKAKTANSKVQKTVPTAQNAPKQEQQVDLEQSFESLSPSKLSASSSVLSKVEKQGNSASALAKGGFASGSKGFGAGGGGQSVGVGAIKGQGLGGGMGAGDYGLVPSKGKEISSAVEEEVKMMGGLDPEVIARIIKRYLSQIQYCYEQQLVKKPTIKGKVDVAFTIMGDGSVSKPRVVKTTLNDAATEACMLDKIKTWKFPKPLGGGTVGVNYPFMLMSNN